MRELQSRKILRLLMGSILGTLCREREMRYNLSHNRGESTLKPVSGLIWEPRSFIYQKGKPAAGPPDVNFVNNVNPEVMPALP